MWQCQKCREQIEESFEVCWSCGTSKDGVEDPGFVQADGAEASVTGAGAGFLKPASGGLAASSCPKCGARQVIPGVRVLDQDGEFADKNLSVRLDRNPNAWIFKGSEVVKLQARVCGSCGYTELYATNPTALWSAYEEQA